MAKKKAKRAAKPSTMPSTVSANKDRVEDVIVAALSAAPAPVLLKVCRLCEAKDGPFLNIFDADKVTAKKIDDLMPFGVAENDDLPHKICFRCSAKVEELYEFIQKCIKTQENLRKMMGKKGPLTMKSKDRVHWEKQLHKTKLSNDDICDVLIKRAMEGIPLNAPLNNVEDKSSVTKKPNQEITTSVESTSSSSDDDDDDDDSSLSLRQVKMSIEKAEEPPIPVRASRCKNLPETVTEQTQNLGPRTYPKRTPVEKAKPTENSIPEGKKEAKVETPKETSKPVEPEKKEETKPFDIMDHVSKIKVNHVGVLFQCKLCNRNFLKKELVLNHGCAKNHAPPKETSSSSTPTPGPPKPSTVQYIKMDNIKKPPHSLIDKTVEKPERMKPVLPPEPAAKPKPKIGPASRVRVKDLPKEPTPPKTPPVAETPILPPSFNLPNAPSLNSRYKLVPGPNNTFQLVEESTASETIIEPETKSRKRRHDLNSFKPKQEEKSSSPDIIELDSQESQRPEPYPVGLFQPVPHHSSLSPIKPPVPFTTPAMKKQSYTIVQTGNPSKLLISTKPQATEEPTKKKSKKKDPKEKEPYKAPVNPPPEPATNSSQQGFFTFVSLDPADILKPSFVLPTDNIIQESQITTSSSAKPSTVPPEANSSSSYSCNMCGETFSREKKLLTHIQSHYNQMDEEDELRTGKPGPKRKTRKS